MSQQAMGKAIYTGSSGSYAGELTPIENWAMWVMRSLAVNATLHRGNDLADSTSRVASYTIVRYLE
ncbi:hypothetical protein [cf. Phormidesmis sp. LEGE 11477]|uniref:hypothetical protein n=1 Tax=cf. Phormidesmis sp. LEGE 11477 TaxID=1828680 RepID=UPI0019DBE672|nr:hypothetical protein [cf. Phormidesmis sp. LEGE 11477]MBE9060911.1 hypothetical protein [cf. Phormidesmis sp. LEGE 11477]